MPPRAAAHRPLYRRSARRLLQAPPADLPPAADYRRPLGVVACDTPLKELQETDGHGVAKGTYAEERAPTPSTLGKGSRTRGWLKFLAWEGAERGREERGRKKDGKKEGGR